MARRHITPEFREEAAKLVVDQGYSFRDACQAMGVGQTALRRWVDQLKAERGGQTPTAQALTPEQQRIQALEAQVRCQWPPKLTHLWPIKLTQG